MLVSFIWWQEISSLKFKTKIGRVNEMWMSGLGLDNLVDGLRECCKGTRFFKDIFYANTLSPFLQ